MSMKAASSESVEEVLSRVSHAALLYYYFNINTLPKLISSPLRQDKHPSFFIYSPDSIKVFYKDYATGEHGDIYSLLQKKFGLSFAQLIRKIAANKELKEVEHSFEATQTTFNNMKSHSEIEVKIREWEDYDIKYWESYGITLKWLKYAEVYPISHKFIYKNNERYVFRAAKLAYVYVERKEGNISLKIYQPQAKRFKWTTSNDGSVVGLWTKVPQKGDKLVICSSLKDALCLWSNTGIPAIYVQSETTGISQTAKEALESRYKRIFICFDNDAPGLKDGQELASKTGFKNIVLPQFDGGKDISDFYKTKGKDEFIKTIKPLFD